MPLKQRGEPGKIMLGHEIKSTDLEIKRAMLAAIRETGIDEVTATHGYILGYLSDNADRDIFQKDIEAHLCIGRSSVTTVLSLMEKKGYIVRRSVEQDARLKKISVTEKGVEINERIRKTIDALDSSLTENVSEEDMSVFLSVLARIRENAGEQRMNAEKNIKKGIDEDD